ncbi:hypothetical protein DL770_008120 [Monosporascus sp. CRB-9-2]|nr:hypothetical protein DL770_008120 [Monosporascus sp. CRB-9-2]
MAWYDPTIRRTSWPKPDTSPKGNFCSAQTIQQLEDGVRLGCTICSKFFSYFHEADRLAIRERRDLNSEDCISGFWKSSGVFSSIQFAVKSKIGPPVNLRQGLPAIRTVISVPVPGPRAEREAHFRMMPAKGKITSDVEPWLVPKRNFGDSTGSSPTILQAQEWLNNCMANHRRCKKPDTRRGRFPSRLLVVGADTVRVEMASRIDSSEPYVTLSHCWGKAEMPVRLLSDTIRQLEAGIAISALPRTFRDAVSVTRSLGQKYLWIDSLCIIQDSEEDWMREGMQMDSVYKNAWCTIAATHARDSTEGLFVERDPRVLQPCPYEVPEDVRTPKYGTDRNNPFYVVDTNLWHYNIAFAPLTSRAWVVQERLLSPRILHFAAEQVFWECQEMAACESFPVGFPEEHINHADGYGSDQEWGTTVAPLAFKSLLSPLPDVGTGTYKGWGKTVAGQIRSFLTSMAGIEDANPDAALQAYEIWCRLVSSYTGCSLSHEKDKLVAIAGIAKRLQPYLDDKPCAGLWEKCLVHGLAWMGSEPGSLSRPEEGYRAPSWSWASVKGLVKFKLGLEWHPFAQVVSCYAPTKDGTGFGQVEYGHLKLRGPLHPVRWRVGKRLEYITREHELFRPGGLRDMWAPFIGSRQDFGARGDHPSARWDTVSDDYESGDFVDKDLRNSTFLAPLGWVRTPPGPRGGFRERHEGEEHLGIGLFLRRRSNGLTERPTEVWYERLGLFQLPRRPGDRDLRTLFGGEFCTYELR